MRSLLLAALASLLAGPAAASVFNSASVGTTGADFLNLGVSARAEAMGEAYSAVADEASALYWNPAAMTQISGRSATLMHAPYLNSSYYDYAAYAQKLGERSAVGADLQYFSTGKSITETDENDTELGSFTPYDLAFALGYAVMIDDSKSPDGGLTGDSVGVSVKYVQSKILNSAQTLAVDLGILSRSYFEDRLRVAFTATNIGGVLKYEQAGERLPMAFRAGTAYKISDDWTSALDVVVPWDDTMYVALGEEYWLLNGPTWRFAARAGFSSETVSDLGGFSGVSAGVGIGLKSMMVDYSFTPMSGLGDAQRISLTYSF